ncbi:hypothetical protein DM02DRAFT_190237 [Periconia macrospinosa]|uniref:Uncharacterized protein n=1 Tax=Periconia macrospinosa TaxID=97972 RepID=A0A2V1D8Q5_9PLEO|nr:hypothetical protein DM02DRAFT_190237 [Periconia macrospinosa]
MLPQTVLLALVATVSAVPLNINLGAYSPALVVGDGEISLGSTEKASTLMATLASGAAQQGGAAAGQQRQNNAAETPAAAPQEPPAEGEAEKRGNVRRAIESFFKRAPTPEAEKLAAYEDAMHWIKRDLAGFNAALSYAREAMKDQPKVELGSEGAGVGIVVNPGINVPANSAAAGSEKKPEKRSEEKRAEVVDDEETPKMTLVAITEV